jgi:hypothetical protein
MPVAWASPRTHDGPPDAFRRAVGTGAVRGHRARDGCDGYGFVSRQAWKFGLFRSSAEIGKTRFVE